MASMLDILQDYRLHFKTLIFAFYFIEGIPLSEFLLLYFVGLYERDANRNRFNNKIFCELQLNFSYDSRSLNDS